MNRNSLFYYLLIIFLWTICSLNAEESFKGDKKDLHIYLVIGQSNMAGRAIITDKENEPIKNCYLLNDKNEWVIATHPYNQFSTIRKDLKVQKLSPAYNFGKTLAEANKNKSIGLVVNARGGTNIESWQKGGKYYSEAVKRTLEAKKAGMLKGVIWHQGESNVNNPDGYLAALEKLINDLRNDLGEKELPFIAGQIGKGDKINEQIAKLPAKVKFTAYVSSEGLKTTDGLHFDTASANLLGKKYAEEMLKLQK